MAWSMPPTGQWGPGMGVPPDVNMGNCTPEQWTAMQQQNWQQWSQWHQQYATWHLQYGNQYSEQYQAMQMGGMPPLPPATAAPPPAPPPPDKPPPPPPHENNQPLYGQALQKSATDNASAQNTAPLNKSSEMTGNNQNRAFATDTLEKNSVNSEALKTLAEEQKAFDIQFQQWEEEFEKWKKANINHPDKKAYKEYEQTFEACKARLLERRLQMKQKKARLLNNDNQAPVAPPRNNIPPLGPPPGHNTSSGDYRNNESMGYPAQNYNNFQNNQYSKMPQHYYRDNNTNKIFEPQDRQESYNNSNTSNVTVPPNMISTEPFLPVSEPPKGIPGLDLVPDTEKYVNKPHEVIDITDEHKEKQFRSDQQPDYSTISKGINNILGDEKIMNILSMMRGQGPQHNNQTNHLLPTPTNSLLPNPAKGLLPNPLNNNQGPYGSNASGDNRPNYIGRNDMYSDNNYGRGQNAPHMNQYNEFDMHEETHQGNKFAAGPPRPYNNRPENIPQNHYNERNQQHNNQSLLPRPGMQQNVRPNASLRSLLDPFQPQNDYTGGELDPRDMQEEVHPQPNIGMRQNIAAGAPPPMKPKWVEEPLFTPSIIVEYEHKPLRLKARDFIEPVHTFDYNHKSKDENVTKRNFEREAEALFTRNPRPEREDRYAFDKHSKDLYYRNHDRTSKRETRDFREEREYRGEEFDERRRFDDDGKDRRSDDRRRDDRDKFYRREEVHRDRDRDREDMYRERDRDLERVRARERERGRSRERDRGPDYSRDRDRDRDINRERSRDYRRSRSREKDNRKRGLSRDSELSTGSKKSREAPPAKGKPKHLIMIDDILEAPGRQMRPEKIVIILRGPPGSGKSYLAKLIRDREAEQGGTVRVMSIDDYFMQEGEIEEKDSTTGKIIKKPSLKYEYDENLEESYTTSLKRAFKRSITDGYFSFLIYDAVNEQLRSYADIWNFARQNGFQVYICTMELDPLTCFKRNIHGRKLEDIEVICGRFFATPDHHIQLDPTTLLQSASIPEVQMEDADDDVTMEAPEDSEVNSSFTSKWEKMDDAVQLARLDGTSRPLRASQPSMEDYLHLEDWTPTPSKPGKKSVRWADIEERREQEKMRAIGFVVGQTDWTRMTDPTMGSAALTQTKYIERVRRS